jgi:hypothetical protein
MPQQRRRVIIRISLSDHRAKDAWEEIDIATRVHPLVAATTVHGSSNRVLTSFTIGLHSTKQATGLLFRWDLLPASQTCQLTPIFIPLGHRPGGSMLALHSFGKFYFFR